MFGLLRGLEIYTMEIADFATKIFYSTDGSLIIEAATVITYNKLLRYINATVLLTTSLDCTVGKCKKGKIWAITNLFDDSNIKIVVTHI